MKLNEKNNKKKEDTKKWFRGAGLYANTDAEGTHFEAVFENGLDRWRNTYIWQMATFQGRLYLGVFNSDYFHLTNPGGFELLSSADPLANDWTVETDDGFGNTEQYGI